MTADRAWRRLALVALVAAGVDAALALDGGGSAAGDRGGGTVEPVDLEAEVSLAAAADPDAVARVWLAPLESVARSLPGYRAAVGEVTPQGGWLHIRLAPGADAGAAAYRLRRELAGLTTTAPLPGSLAVAPAGAAGELQALVALRGGADNAAVGDLARRLRALPNVRAVERYGGWTDDLVVRARGLPGALPPRWLAHLAAWQSRLALGSERSAGTARPLIDRGPDGRLTDLEVPGAAGARPLAAVADISWQRDPQPRQFHLQGRSEVALAVTFAGDPRAGRAARDLRRALDRLPAGRRAEILRDDAARLHRLFLCLALGVLGAAVVWSAAGWQFGGPAGACDALLCVLAAVSAALLACRAAALTLDAASLPPAAAGIAAALAAGLPGCLAGAPRRRLLAAAAPTAIAVPAALYLGALTPSAAPLAAPSWCCALAALATLAALALSPRPAPSRISSRGRRALRWPRWLRASLRAPEATLVTGIAAIVLVLILAWGQLVPVPRAAAADAGDLELALPLTPGADLAEAERQVGVVEQALGRLDGVERFWSLFDARQARFTLRPAGGWRDRGHLDLLLDRLRLELPPAVALGLRRDAAEAPGHVLPEAPDLLDRPAADEDGTYYGCILGGASLQGLRQGYSRLAQELLRRRVKRDRLQPPSWPTRLREELAPRPGVSPAAARRAAAALAARTSPLARLPLPGHPDQALVLAMPGVELVPSAAPQREAVLAEPLVTAAGPLRGGTLLAVERHLDPGPAARQGGRFVLPVRIAFPSLSAEARRSQREDLDSALARLPLPPGVELERPALTTAARVGRSLAEAAPALLLLALWLVLALLWLPPLAAAIATLLPTAAGLAAVAATVALGAGDLDLSGALLATAGLLAALPLAFDLAHLADRAAAGAAGCRAAAWRAFARREPAAGWALLTALTLLAVAALAAPRDAAGGAPPLALAAVAAAASTLAALYLVPGLLLAARHRRAGAPPAAAISAPIPAAAAIATSAGASTAPADPAAGAAPSSAAIPADASRDVAPPPSLTVRNLTKTYPGGVKGLAGVSFALQPGIVGLLGPNGAGKTTLLRLLVGLLAPTRGSIFCAGQRITPAALASYRRQVGYLPQGLAAYPTFTVRAWLEHWADGRRLPSGAGREREIEALLARVSLSEHQHRRARDLSGGMLRRLGIATALLGSPGIVVADEPTAGLDLAARAEFRELLLATLAERPRIFLVSTHIASDIEALASRLLVLGGGRLRYDGSVAGLVALARGRVFQTLVADTEIVAWTARYRLTSRVRRQEGVEIRGLAPTGEPPPGAVVEPTLEEAYLALLHP